MMPYPASAQGESGRFYIFFISPKFASHYSYSFMFVFTLDMLKFLITVKKTCFIIFNLVRAKLCTIGS